MSSHGASAVLADHHRSEHCASQQSWQRWTSLPIESRHSKLLWLREQKIGTPDRETLRSMAHEYGIEQFTGPAGSALMFDCNVMHGSGSNITPYPRSNIFNVFNSVENVLEQPYAAAVPRPAFVANRDGTPIG